MGRIERSELEAKFRELQAEVDETATAAKPAVIAVGVALLTGISGIAYVLGQRKARKTTTVVEIRRE